MVAIRRALPFLLLLTLVPWVLVGKAYAQAAPPAVVLQDPAVLVDKARALLQERAASFPGHALITVTPPAALNQVACTQMETFVAGASGLQSRTTVGIRCLAPRPWTTYLQANIQVIGSYFVARHTIARGALITAGDVETREGDLLRNPRAMTDRSRVIGWISTRAIRAGGTLESSALRDPNSVQRGDQVRTVARGTGFVVSSEGQALESGGPGSQIQVRTTNGRIISGTVVNAHTVQVMM
ncbi:MAG TPA: flagellar basal body P-ring formation chaperone FlgA [Castellaniella sp.]|uniref:flagellar basal body P-ring formation chaperone FlgA n=1 Tax=Castellaniella sp. TaxID=1955812 RepID=UPI002EE9B9A6